MKQKIIEDAELAPASLGWNNLALDPELPLTRQLDDLYDDMLSARFVNGCCLIIGWLPELSPVGRFRIDLNQNPDIWEPFARAECRSLAELKRFALVFAESARARKSVYLFSGRDVDVDEVWKNELLIDPALTLNDQSDLVDGEVFRAFVGSYALIIYFGASDKGDFVITLRSDPLGLDDVADHDALVERRRGSESWPVIAEQTCDDATKLKQIVIDLVKRARISSE